MNAEGVDVTAGLGGFLAFFVLAVALYFLMRNMNARMRRMAYREELEARAAEGSSSAADEQAAPDEAPDERAAPDPGTEPGDGPDTVGTDDDSGPTRS